MASLTETLNSQLMRIIMTINQPYEFVLMPFDKNYNFRFVGGIKNNLKSKSEKKFLIEEQGCATILSALIK